MILNPFALRVDTLPEARTHLVLGPEELPTRGSLADTPVARLLGRALATGASGILVLRDRSFTVSRGRPVCSGADRKEIADRLVDCLAWREGSMRFDRDPFGDPGFGLLPLDLGPILTAGVAAHYSPARLARELPVTEDHHVYPGGLYEEALGHGLGTREKIALTEVGARPTIGQLSHRLDEPFETLHRTLFVLFHMGAIGFDLVGAAGEPDPVDQLRDAYAVDPANPIVAARLAHALLLADPLAFGKDAGELACDAREANPTLPLPYVVLGMILERVPDPDRAAVLYRHALSCDPSCAEARTGLARLEMR